MESSRISILLVSNDPLDESTSKLLEEHLGSRLVLERRHDVSSARAFMLEHRVDAILLDIERAEISPPEAVAAIRDGAVHVPVIVLSRREEPEFAIQAIRAGAHDFVVKKNLTAQALGRIIDFAVERQKLLDRQHERIGQLSAARDHAESVANELGQSGNRLKLALHATRMMLWDWNIATDRTSFGEGIDELLGRVPGDPAVRRPERWQDLIHPEDRNAALRGVHRFLQEPDGDYEDSFRILTTDGPKAVIARGRMVKRTAEGEAPRMAGTFLDISERVEMEKRISLSQKLEAIGQLAAGIAHEINTPMQYIGDNIAFLQNSLSQLVPCLEPMTQCCPQPADADKQAEDTPEQEQFRESLKLFLTEAPAALDDCVAGVQSVARIVRAMKEFAHPGTEEKTSVDVNSVVESMVAISRNEWKYVAEIRRNLDPSLSPVQAISGELGQVILNMIVNAAQAIGAEPSRGGLGLITITTRDLAEWVEVRISDNGPGIPAAIRHRIFEPFFTTKEVGKGTGQGLAIAHTVVVQKHGGTIDVMSEVGEGTTFTVRLPKTREAGGALEHETIAV